MKNRSRHLISIVFSFVAILIIPFITMVFTMFYDYSSHSENVKIVVIGILILSLVCLLSFLICIFNKRGVWYIPLILNLGTILTANAVLSNYWTKGDRMQLLIISLVLSYVFGLLGFLFANKKLKTKKGRQN